MQTTLFISDLHLSQERPQQLEMFRQLLRGPARRARALYILGDLFEEFWLGNDDTTPPIPDAVRELSDFTSNGGKLYLQRGNRDLLLDDGFVKLTGGSLLADQAVIDLDGERVLIMHGDLLCTRDVRYQAYRRLVANTVIQGMFAVLPYRVRTTIARGLKPAMKRSTMLKSDEITDVEPAAVVQAMRTHKVQSIIHGHTHRPGVHNFQVDGNAATRTVLGDWCGNDGRILLCKGVERRLLPVRDFLLYSV